MLKCNKPGHKMTVRNIPREWKRMDGSSVFRIYAQVYCDTCKKERQEINKGYIEKRKRRKGIMA